MEDPYFKLRPQPPTPGDEVCDCREVGEVYLAHKLGPNPLHCLRCNGEVPPERLGLSESLAERIARWNAAYGALYALWLDSGEYEAWAKERLVDVDGQVNHEGLILARDLGALSKAYYLWFYENEPPAACPVCGGPLQLREECNRLACEHCLIVM